MREINGIVSELIDEQKDAVDVCERIVCTSPTKRGKSKGLVVSNVIARSEATKQARDMFATNIAARRVANI